MLKSAFQALHDLLFMITVSVDAKSQDDLIDSPAHPFSLASSGGTCFDSGICDTVFKLWPDE